jgi:hypothetical protein
MRHMLDHLTRHHKIERTGLRRIEVKQISRQNRNIVIELETSKRIVQSFRTQIVCNNTDSCGGQTSTQRGVVGGDLKRSIGTERKRDVKRPQRSQPAVCRV